jgi:ribosome-associated translation inhibitor RaiA
MKIQVNTGSSYQGSTEMDTFVSNFIQEKLERYSDRITRVEVHFADHNGEKETPMDKSCKVEVRMEGRPPFFTTGRGDTSHNALTVATMRMESHLGKQLKDN